MKIGSLFSGYEGLGMGVQSVLGGDIAWVSDIDPGACKILAHRYPDVPNIGDITAVDWSAVEPVDVLTGGFPCQDVSAAGKRRGIRPDTRSGLWSQFAYAIDQLRPGLVVIENVRGLLSADAHHPAHSDLEPCDWCVGDGSGSPLRALGAVLGDLADIGYDASWQGLRAADVGAPHGRFRVFVVAWPASDADLAATARLADAQERPAFARAAAWRGGAVAPADADGTGLEGAQPAPGRQLSDWGATADTDRSRDEAEQPTRFRLRDSYYRKYEESSGRDVDWGIYTIAVRRWEWLLQRPAPAPVEPGKNGQPRLSPAFVEWMQGLPAGWVTDVPGLSRNEQLKALGNGVVPQQAAQALRMLLTGSPAATSADARPLLQTPLTTTATGVQQLERQVGGRGSRGVA